MHCLYISNHDLTQSLRRNQTNGEGRYEKVKQPNIWSARHNNKDSTLLPSRKCEKNESTDNVYTLVLSALLCLSLVHSLFLARSCALFSAVLFGIPLYRIIHKHFFSAHLLDSWTNYNSIMSTNAYVPLSLSFFGYYCWCRCPATGFNCANSEYLHFFAVFLFFCCSFFCDIEKNKCVGRNSS